MTNGNSADEYKRMFEDAVRDLAWITEAIGLDPDEAGGAEPIINAIEELKERALSVCADGGKGEAVATLHDDGYWTWKGTPPHESNYAGWRMDVYATPQAECAPRADADTAWAKPVAWIGKQTLALLPEHSVDAILTGHKASVDHVPLYAGNGRTVRETVMTDKEIEHIWHREAYHGDIPWGFARALLAAGASERADAEKDAALELWRLAEVSNFDEFEAYLCAILAATKDK